MNLHGHKGLYFVIIDGPIFGAAQLALFCHRRRSGGRSEGERQRAVGVRAAGGALTQPVTWEVRACARSIREVLCTEASGSTESPRRAHRIRWLYCSCAARNDDLPAPVGEEMCAAIPRSAADAVEL